MQYAKNNFPAGSSPLARGAQRHGRNLFTQLGLIPARAGSTGSPEAQAGYRGAHPRSRGEHAAHHLHTFRSVGSSPLARGALLSRIGGGFSRGLIPARAGSTWRISANYQFAWAHPRSRGEHTYCVPARCETTGSSPLARGARRLFSACTHSLGLIPARAGSTFFLEMAGENRWAHPRSRGEHERGSHHVGVMVGSSPLARGALYITMRCLLFLGLIPARAGSTRYTYRYTQKYRAHPRSRGEHGHHGVSSRAVWGSSPLARGALDLPGGLTPTTGLIPARAGSTLVGCEVLVKCRAHPRSRGEHNSLVLRGDMSWGSSPLARGAPVRWASKITTDGLIPARAGSTVVAQVAV